VSAVLRLIFGWFFVGVGCGLVWVVYICSVCKYGGLCKIGRRGSGFWALCAFFFFVFHLAIICCFFVFVGFGVVVGGFCGFGGVFCVCSVSSFAVNLWVVFCWCWLWVGLGCLYL
jgi:hypothetical protein